MPKLWYVQSGAKHQGDPRAQLPWEQCENILGQTEAKFLGTTFPYFPGKEQAKTAPYTIPDVALLEVTSSEATEKWKAGFYRLTIKPLECEMVLKKLGMPP